MHQFIMYNILPRKYIGHKGYGSAPCSDLVDQADQFCRWDSLSWGNKYRNPREVLGIFLLLETKFVLRPIFALMILLEKFVAAYSPVWQL